MRENRSLTAFALLAMLTLVGAGCSQRASVTTATPDAPAPAAHDQAAPSPAPSAATSDACGNPYYPFTSGFTITYGASQTPSKMAIPDYTMRVTSVVGTVASLHTEVANGFSVDMTADCANGAVALKGSFDLGSAAQGAKIKTTPVSSSGTFLPADVAVGATWENAQTMKIEMLDGPAAAFGPITTTTETKSKAIGEESVTVPAGTFTAMKVEVTRTTTADMSAMKLPGGVKPPAQPPTVTTSTEWWAKGVGMIKNVSVSSGTTTTVQAKAINPQ